jgi:hypothetical protein
VLAGLYLLGSEPAYRQLVIEAAPAVLGATRCREIEKRIFTGS